MFAELILAEDDKSLLLARFFLAIADDMK